MVTGADLSLQTHYLSESGTPVGGPIAVDFKGGRAYVANGLGGGISVIDYDLAAPGGAEL